MTNKLMNQMGLHKSKTNIFAERIINTAKEALSLTEFELMELLDVGLLEVAAAVAHIIEIASPPYQTRFRRGLIWWNPIWCLDRACWSSLNWPNAR
ncbi:DNA repair protein RAD51 homolog 2-like [Cucurbita moschata]|uniref:DNA repair protein RAD51 homolog 2-like n=1 Tax=Cucurbita moschata TaxID=3662 RepID=A0A6J1G5H9_CUCMO|nr:DNA repair protein RAD51 homolog 2-like [Cucurbita moschata]